MSEPGKPRATLEEKPHRPPSRPPQVAAAAASTEQTWRRNAVPFRDLNSKPLIAIVIDDVGLDRPRSKRAWELPGPLTMSFLPYAKDLREQARAARARGHELMLHLPMEPNGRNDPGPGALLVSLERRRAAPAHGGGARQLRRLCRRQQPHGQPLHGLPAGHGDGAAAVQVARADVPRLAHHGAVGRRPDGAGAGRARASCATSSSTTRSRVEAVRRKLAEVEAVARRQGFVVAIGHPHEATLQALAEWLPDGSGQGSGTGAGDRRVAQAQRLGLSCANERVGGSQTCVTRSRR